MTQIQPLNTGIAIVIGINKYTNGIPSLKNAVNDAKKVAEMLQSKYNYQVVLLLDEAATLSRIKELLAAIKQQQIPLNNHTVKIEENHRIFFYFAGHGIALDGLEDARAPQGFLVPQDGKLNEEKILLPMTELHDALIALPCRHLLVVLDCCFAGSFRWAGLNRNAARSQKLYREKYERFTNSKAQQVITSAAYDEKALDSIYRLGKRGEIDGHSPFAEVLLKGLEGEADYSKDGAITANELYLYLQTELDKQKVTQNPGICYLKNHEKGEYIFPVPGFNPNNLDNAPPLSDDNNPYRGLASFDEIHQGLFFGRQGVIEDLYRAFNDKKKLGFTAVLGASGTGKSSLVKAGLLPRLREDRWYIVNPFRPGKSPFSALAAAMFLTVLTREVSLVKTRFFESLNATNYGSVLAWQGFLDIGEIFQKILAEYNDQKIVDSLSDFLREKPKLLTKVAGIGHSKVPEKLLLVIDQFEELVTDCPAAEKDKFLGWLEEILRDNSGKVRVIITLRSDFKAQFTSELFDEKVLQFTVPMMTQDEYREVIEKPAGEKVLYFEPPELVDELINEVVQMPGALPLLSFTLSQLYFRCCDRWLMGEKSRTMTREDYQKLGGVMGALKRTATDVFEKLIKEKKGTEQTIRDVMLRMVAVSGDELARRRVPMWELVYPEPKNGEVEEVLNAFTTARLLVEGATSDGEEYVEPAHDALVTGWDKILKWKNQQQESLLLQRRLTPAAMEWKQKQQKGFLWNANPYLDVLRQVLKSNDNWFNQTEASFVKSSIRRNRSNRLRSIGAIASFIGLVLSFAGIQYVLRIDAEIQSLASSSEAFFNSNKELEASIESVKTGVKFKNAVWTGTDTRMRAITALQKAVYETRERNRLEGYSDNVWSATFSPDSKLVAAGTVDHKVILWHLDGNAIKTLEGHNGAVNCVSFSPDGQMIASASSDKTIKLWSSNGSLIKTLQQHSSVWGVSFSPNGDIVASNSWDGTIKLWTRDGEFVRDWKWDKGLTGCLKFSPDGQIIASATNDNLVALWSVDGKLLTTLKGHRGPIKSLSFSHDGQTIATGSSDQTVKLWSLDGKLLRTITGHKLRVTSVSFTPNSKILASASGDRTIKLWSRDGKELKTLKGHGSRVFDVSFSPDGKFLLSSSNDKTVRVWNVEEVTRETLPGKTVDFSEDGKIMTLSSLESSVSAQFWSRDRSLLKSLHINNVKFFNVIFSKKNSEIAFVDNGGVIHVIDWKSQTIKAIAAPEKTQHDFIAVPCLSFSPDDRTIAIFFRYEQSRVFFSNLDIDSGKELNNPSKVLIWNLDSGEVKNINNFNNLDLFGCVSFSHDGNTIAISSWENKAVNLLNLKTRKLKTLKGHLDVVDTVAFSPNGNIIATGSRDNTIKLWTAKGTLIETLRGHSGWVNDISFSHNGKLLASVSKDRTLKIWSIDGRELATFPLERSDIEPWDVSFSPDDRILATSTNNGKVILWNLDVDDLVERGCNWLRDYLRNPNANLNDKDRHLCDDILNSP